MRTAILIHGCHLEAEEWESIIWGDPQNDKLGRAPKGIQLAFREKADLIYWGTGASEKDGRKESQHIFDHTITHAGQLAQFDGFDPYEVERILSPLSYIDTETQNTTQEVEKAAGICRERGIERLILVSSPTHIARCLQEAEKLRTAGKLGGIEVLATASDTCFAHSTPDDVVIVEPPHRGDMPKWQTYRYVRAMFGLVRKPEDFRHFLHDLGDLLWRHGVTVDWDPRD